MALRKDKVEVKETISNVSVGIISITEDKLVNILNTHIAKIKKNHDWITALALFVSLFGIALTTEFKNVLGIDALMITGGYYVLVFLSLCYFVRVVYHCYKNRDSIDSIMQDIKNQK